jgi:hypothetical protein
MYIQGHEQYEYHVKHYGHPSKFGFKDVIQTWKGDKFDPDYLLSLYKKRERRIMLLSMLNGKRRSEHVCGECLGPTLTTLRLAVSRLIL